MAQSKRATGLIADKGIELLTYGTPNGQKISIMLEELKEAYGKEYTYQSISLFEGVQKEPWFTKLNPNGCIPVIVDHDKGGFAVMEGMAIFNYLTRHYDPENKFCFEDPLEVSTAEQWLAWAHSGLGPIQAKANFFYRFQPQRHGFPTQHFIGETERNYGILDARLADRDYVAGPGRGKYSIADIPAWAFINAAGVTGLKLEKFPNIYRWWERIGERPAVQKGLKVPSGEEFAFGYKVMQKKAQEDPQGTEEREGPLREALEKAQKEFGYVYKSP
ncbi:glutathione S-transferase [Massariosphaeria phaeospora]|uniref:Glutathione S-transferase n=1 Tax=Massariosphaeria phaeospora TaxID=100035 RepID=A0A7C8IIF2_9PLEO|nr:glutathione S-transferase [Massariosphaeria phaeospora]